jgi:hypothetical protein
MDKDKKIEDRLFGSFTEYTYEHSQEEIGKREILEAREIREKLKETQKQTIKETDFSKVAKSERFDKKSIYAVFNRKEKTENFVTGDQAEVFLKYPHEYIVKFDHRIIED